MRALTGEDQAFFAVEERQSLLPAQWTTALLERCVSGEVRDLTVGQRERMLLELRRISFGDRLECVLTCSACGEKLDLELRVRDLLSASEKADSTQVAEHSLDGVRFRLPTGADQEAAALVATSDVDAAVQLLLDRCVQHQSPLSPALLDAIMARMAELDPQAEMRIDASCPACGAVSQTLFDAAGYLMQEMRSGIRNLYREVHILAWHYHWSVGDILRLTLMDRKRYLALIDEQLGGVQLGGLQ